MPISATVNNPEAPRGRRATRRNHVRPELSTLPEWVHPEVAYWYDSWKLIRDAASGEKDIKGEGTRYLPRFDGMNDTEYAAYLENATYYNFTGRTLGAMKNAVFRRRATIEGVPARFLKNMERISRAGSSFMIYSKFTAREILALGRFGTLVDMPASPSTDPKPYLVGYLAENILDWDSDTDPETGRERMRRWTLREWVLSAPTNGKPGSARQYLARYRTLMLEAVPPYNGLVYTQRVNEPTATGDAVLDLSVNPTVILRRGQPIPFIPFRIFGAIDSTSTVEQPPMLDIAQLNISHYRSYAHLEHGRVYTGFPIYNVEVSAAGESEEYEIGPNRVWETPAGCQARVLEMNGQGLKFLENALHQKEAQAAALGGRMIGVTPQSVSESDNQLRMKDRNEASILLDVAHSLDEGATTVLRWWVWFSGASQEEADAVSVEYNKDFLLDSIGAREFRAIQSMYKDGVIPIEVVYDYLRKAEVIPDHMKIEEFRRLLESATSFPNQPDFDARKKGFPDKKTQLADERADDELEFEQEQAEEDRKLEREAQAAQERATRLQARVAERAAARQAAQSGPGGRPAPGNPGPGGRPAPGNPGPGGGRRQ
jgi:hypothetical protein